MEKIDLHIHTNKSDGKLSPKEVIDTAVKNGLKWISITDHDTIDAYTDEIIKYAIDKKINLIKGVEISTKIAKAGIHVLGYNIDITNQNLKKELANLRNKRHKYLYDVEAKLNELGYIVNTNKLDKIEAVTKAHIALDVIENKKNSPVLIKNFGHLPSKGEFIETVMNEGCPAYVKKETITPKKAAEIIRAAGGKVILAHPVAYQYEDNLNTNDILDLVQTMKADGIEAYYIYVDRYDNKINDISKWQQFAQNNHLITTIGSDFHNYDNLRPVIGLLNENIQINEEEIIKNITT